jgi:hypothetical protein
LLKYGLEQFIGYLLLQHEVKPMPEVKSFDLGALDKVQCGFSGLNTLDENRLLCTVSAEDTLTTYDDGAVLGSYIGIIDVTIDQPAIQLVLLEENGKPVAEKAESVAVLKRINDTEVLVLAVTDNDENPSNLLKVKLTLR